MFSVDFATQLRSLDTFTVMLVNAPYPDIREVLTNNGLRDMAAEDAAFWQALAASGTRGEADDQEFVDGARLNPR